MDQISEGGRSIHEIDKIRKRLEAEKMELQSALEEAEATLEQEENKVLRCQLELNAVRQEIERRLAEKEEEFILVKKAQSKALDSMQVALETETKSKAEALRMKKKLEGDAADLGLALEHAIAGNAEPQTTIKKYALQVRDAQAKVDDESAAKSAAADAKVTADRKRRAAEQELADTNETLADLPNVNQSISASKRKLEGELGQLNADLDEMTNEAKMSEDKAARAMVDAARLADELRCEQELAMNLEKDKKLLEAQCKDAATRADEAEVTALNLAKYRKVAGALGDAEASADSNEQAMAMRKARAKSASLGL